jgi:hypothetical protein
MVLVFSFVISLGYSQDWKTNFELVKKKLPAKPIVLVFQDQIGVRPSN